MLKPLTIGIGTTPLSPVTMISVNVISQDNNVPVIDVNLT